MKLTPRTLARGLKIPLERANFWHGYLLETFEKYGINSDLEQLCFVAQVAYETQQLRHTVENLYYMTPERVLAVFPSFIKPSEAPSFVANSQKLANRVYANRLGNGDEASGDGWKFIGRGAFHLTGRANYTSYAEHSGIDCVKQPELVQEIDHACLSAGWYWKSRDLGKYVDKFALMTKFIAGTKYTTPRREAILKSLQEATR